MDDLWESASGAHEDMAREASLARADAELELVMPFLLAARSGEEFLHRMAAAETSLVVLAARAGVTFQDVADTARRRYDLYREALAEGQDPTQALDPLLNGGGQGSGPEKPDSHSEGPDFSQGYSEVPAGPPGGPDPQVTAPRQTATPVAQPMASLRRQADGQGPVPGYSMPPDLGTGSGSLDLGVPSEVTGGTTPSIPAGKVTASADPVRSRVLRATAMIAEANPGLPQAECERLGRRVVSRYLRTADLTNSVMSNEPLSDGGGGAAPPGGDGAAGRALEGQGLRSMLPGGGEGGAAAGGAAPEAEEALPLVAL